MSYYGPHYSLSLVKLQLQTWPYPDVVRAHTRRGAHTHIIWNYLWHAESFGGFECISCRVICAIALEVYTRSTHFPNRNIISLWFTWRVNFQQMYLIKDSIINSCVFVKQLHHNQIAPIKEWHFFRFDRPLSDYVRRIQHFSRQPQSAQDISIKCHRVLYMHAAPSTEPWDSFMMHLNLNGHEAWKSTPPRYIKCHAGIYTVI